MNGERKMPISVLLGGPAAVFGYWVATWLLKNDPEHWLIRSLSRAADWISERLPKWLCRPRRTSPKDRAQRRGGTGHFLVLLGPERCRCGSSWPCLDSVPGDRRTISA